MDNIKLEKEQFEKQEDVFSIVSKEIKSLKNQCEEEDFDLKYNELRDRSLKENPKERLAFELLFGIKDYVFAQEKLRGFGKEFLGYKDLKSSKEEVINLASWNQEATKFLAKHEHDKELVQAFWSNYKAIFDLFSKDEKSRDGIIRGIVGQASVYHILSHAGFKPEISTPQEDVFEKIDLKISFGRKDILIQVKQHHDTGQPLVVGTKEIKYPSIALKEKNKDVHFSSYDIQEMTALQEICEEKSRRENKKIEAFYIIIPSGKCDSDTGKPSPDFLRKIKPQIRSLSGR